MESGTDDAVEPTARLMAALAFAARKHRHQRRKGADAPPFINHAIEVAELLTRIAGVSDPVTLQAAVLHDTIEDTGTKPAEIEAAFGPEVRTIVEEVSDDKSLEHEERRRRQVANAPALSEPARLIRIADKIANARAIADSPPVPWSLDRCREYLLWTREVVDGCRGCCPELEAAYDEALQRGLETIVRRRSQSADGGTANV